MKTSQIMCLLHDYFPTCFAVDGLPTEPIVLNQCIAHLTTFSSRAQILLPRLFCWHNDSVVFGGTGDVEQAGRPWKWAKMQVHVVRSGDMLKVRFEVINCPGQLQVKNCQEKWFLEFLEMTFLSFCFPRSFLVSFCRFGGRWIFRMVRKKRWRNKNKVNDSGQLRWYNVISHVACFVQWLKRLFATQERKKERNWNLNCSSPWAGPMPCHEYHQCLNSWTVLEGSTGQGRCQLVR